MARFTTNNILPTDKRDYPAAPDWRTQLRISWGKGIIGGHEAFNTFMRYVPEPPLKAVQPEQPVLKFGRPNPAREYEDIAIDIGSQEGSWTLPMARKFHSVVAIESDPKLARFLERNLRRANLTNVNIFGAAVGRKDTIDHILEPSGLLPHYRVNAMRVNTNGATLSSLESAEETLATHQPALLINVGKSSGVKTAEALGFIGNLGYYQADRVADNFIFAVK